MSSDVMIWPDELLERARNLAPDFRERAKHEPSARRISKATIADLRQAGLFRVLQANRNGGFALDLTTHLNVVSAVAEGCPSTAWVVGVAHAHSWLVSHFTGDAQDDVYSDDPDTLVAGVLAPRGEAVPAGDGWLLNGVWPFGSGVERSQWALLGATTLGASGEPNDAQFLVRTAALDVADDWHVSGLKATGSCSIVAKDAFVPRHRHLSMKDVASGTAPGSSLHDEPVHRSAMVPVLTIALTGAALGAGRAAVTAFAEQITGQVATSSTELQTNLPTTHRQVAQAATLVHQGGLLLENGAMAIDEHARADRPMAIEDRARIRMECAQGVRCCLEAAELLYLATGGRGLQTTNRLAGLLADLQAINMHALLNLDTSHELYGRVLLGLPVEARI